jgi:hypothetical protein
MNPRVDPDDLRKRLAELDDQVAGMLRARYGGDGSGYTAARELWHRGAAEVQVGFSILARLVALAESRRHAHRVVNEIDSLATALPASPPGRDAAAHTEARRHWTRGEAMMRESLARLRAADAPAHTN